MIRLVLFDIDGTLISTRGAGVQAFGEAFATVFGVRNGTAEMTFAGRTDVSLTRELFLRHQVAPTEENFRRFFDAYVFWLDHLVHTLPGRVLPGVERLLTELARLNPAPALGLLTGNTRLGAEIKLRRFRLWEAFILGAFAEDNEDRDQIAMAARGRAERYFQRQLRGEEIVVVGDTPHDIRCGRAIGARVLAVATGGAKADHLSVHRPDWLVEDLSVLRAGELCRL